MSEWNNDETYQNPVENPDVLPFEELESEQHPIPEMMLLREAIAKGLTHKQRELWYMYAYNKLTQEEIAKKLNVSQPAINQRIKTAEKAIVRYCKKHKNKYAPIIEVQYDDSVGC